MCIKNIEKTKIKKIKVEKLFFINNSCSVFKQNFKHLNIIFKHKIFTKNMLKTTKFFTYSHTLLQTTIIFNKYY